MRPEPDRRRAGGKWLTAGSILGALLVGWLIGHASSPSPDPAAPGTRRAGAAQTDAGVPVDFPATPAGAAAAVASYQRSFASPEILSPGALRRRIEAVAMPDYVDAMLAANSPGAERLAAGPLGTGIAADVQTIYSAVPIGYRIESFTPRRARILTWGFTLLGNAAAVEPSAYFGLTRTELLRHDGAWKIAETRGGFGPTPKLATPPGPLEGYDVIGLASQLRSYVPVP